MCQPVRYYIGIYWCTIPPSLFLSIRFLSSSYQTSVVYQLQRRVRTLREQLQRRDLHLDLLRRKLSLQEESVKMKSLLQNERDEACLRYVHSISISVYIYIYIYRFVFRAKKLSKQTDRLQAQILEERSRNRELSAQLTEAADYKVRGYDKRFFPFFICFFISFISVKIDSRLGAESKDRRASETIGGERDAEDTILEKIEHVEGTNEKRNRDRRTREIHQRSLVAIAEGRVGAG